MSDSSRLFPALPNPPEDPFSVQSKFPSAMEAGWELSLADLCFKCQGCFTLAFQIPFAFFNPCVGLGSKQEVLEKVLCSRSCPVLWLSQELVFYALPGLCPQQACPGLQCAYGGCVLVKLGARRQH